MEGALIKEIEVRMQAENPDLEEIQSIYFGGGTPSLFPASGLKRLLGAFLPEASACREITLEANPEDVTRGQLDAWRSMGITRLSIGIQTFDENRLAWMNRKHSASDAEQAVRWAAEAGFEHLTADLIYGIPGRTHTFEHELERFVSLPVDHLSAYILTVEDQTALGRNIQNGKAPAPDEGQIESEYHALCSAMTEAGFAHYEVSNWARPGGHAVHNRHYWSGLPYWGIGPGAHSFSGMARTANVSNNPRYIRALNSAQGIQDLPLETDALNPIDRYNESIMTGLRTANGIDLVELEKVHRLRPDLQNAVDWQQLISTGQLIASGADRFRIPEVHWLFADRIASALFHV